MVVEIRLRSKTLDEVLDVAGKIGEALKATSGEPKFNENFGDFTIYFVVRGGE